MSFYDELFRDSPATPREEQLLDALSQVHLNLAYALDFRNEVARALRELAGRGLSTPRELHAITDCAQVERDALDLHQALAEAVRVMRAVTSTIMNSPEAPVVGGALWALPAQLENDLRYTAERTGGVLNRTSRPVA